MSSFRIVTGSALALALGVPHARAQTNGGAVTLPPVTVTAQPSGSLTVPSVEAQHEQLNQTAGSVGWVDSEAYKGRYANNLRDVLEDTPGVYVQTRYGQELRLSIRGSGIARSYHTRGIELLQDGVPTNLADGSGDFYQIDPLGLRSAEVYKGGNALPFGSSTLGGAINFVTPTAYTAIAPDVVRFDGGTFGTFRGSAQASRVLGDADFLINATVSHADGYRDHMTQQYEQINGNIGYRITPDTETRFYFGAYITEQQLPGTLGLRAALTAPTQASASAVSGNQARNVYTERLANRTTVSLNQGRLDFDTWVIHKGLYHPIFQVIDQDGFTYGFGPRYTGNFDVLGLRDEVIAGGRVFGGNTRALQYINVAGNRAAQTLNSRQDAWSVEGYLENRLFIVPTVALVAGAKLLHANRNYTDLGGLPPFDTSYKSYQKDYDGFNPKFGVLWQPKPTIQAFADITRSQDVPDFGDLTQTQINGATGFVPLASQRAWTLEAGTRGHYDRFTWDVTLYHSWVDGQLLQYTTNPNFPASSFNAGRTNLQGVELGAAMELLRGIAATADTLTLSQIWNWSDFHFSNDPQYGNNRIAGVPEHVFRTTLAYRHPSGFYAAPSVDIVPTGAFVDFANTQRVPAYALVGLQAGMDFDNGVSVFMDARNLSNARYVSDFGTVTRYSASGTQTFYPGDGRSLYAGARVKF